MVKCRKCDGDMAPQTVALQKKRGTFASIMWILAACCTAGIILLIPLLTKKGSKVQTFMVCQNCGYRQAA